MWMVRCAERGRLFEDFKEKSVVAIGWGEVGDLSNFNDRAELVNRIKEIWPLWKAGTHQSSASQLYRFANEIRKGDRVLTYDPARRVYLVGTIKDKYQYAPKKFNEMPNIWPVSWEAEIERDRLTVTTRNSLGAIQTLFLLPDDAAQDVELAIKSPTKLSQESEAEDELAEEENVLEGIEQRATEFIKDRLNRLSWDDMQESVAGLLRAMGYKTRISPAGPDRGKDIVASPDGFGFESPRIVVEVKHRSGAMGAKEIRSFLGGRHQDDKGLYVSTGGFTKDAYYEAERASIPLTLLSLDDLVRALIENYANLDVDTKQLIPLKQVYIPA